MQNVFVSFKTDVDQFKVEIAHSVKLKKIKTLELKTHIKAFSSETEMFFTRNNETRMISTPYISVKYSSPAPNSILLLFILTSFHSHQHAIIVDNNLLVLGKNNEELFKKDISSSPHGLAFDLQENV